MDIYLYNTIKRKKERFEPIEPGKISMYVCGPTVYDTCHIGHARSAVVFDVIVRFFRAVGYEVNYVRNFTDVDDKIIKRANELGVAAEKLAEKYIQEFYRDMDALHVERATFEPRVTQHMDDIIDVIGRLIDKGYAYQVDGEVFFAVTSFRGYGKLSNRSLAEMEAGARVEIDKRKKNPFDFALWKASKPNEPFWDSPWGKGRPGWHIECSAMSSKYLGETFDIHGGGKDLIFPHHENEIAQSEAANGRPFARYWIHNGFIRINHEKMSKSLGNFLMIKDVLKNAHPETIRLFLLAKQYRKPIDYSPSAIHESGLALDRIYSFLSRVNDFLGVFDDASPGRRDETHWQQFCAAMADDFNTASGLAVVFEAVRSANRMLDENHEKSTPDLRAAMANIRRGILQIGAVLGLFQEDAQAYLKGKKSVAAEKMEIDAEAVRQLIKARDEARKNKDWATADSIRDQLAEMQVVLEDRPDETVWKIKTDS